MEADRSRPKGLDAEHGERGPALPGMHLPPTGAGQPDRERSSCNKTHNDRQIRHPFAGLKRDSTTQVGKTK